MTIHQDVYAKAQQTIDEVVGNHRLPDLSDREELPYVDAILKEVYRLAAPLCDGSFCSLNVCCLRINVPLPISTPRIPTTIDITLTEHSFYQVYPVA